MRITSQNQQVNATLTLCNKVPFLASKSTYTFKSNIE